MSRLPDLADRPFVDRPVDDVQRAQELADQVCRRRGWPAPTLLRVGMNTMFGAGEFVVRVSAPTAPGLAAIELMRRLRRRGIPAPEPVDDVVHDGDGLVATGWRRIVPTGDPVDWRAVGEVVRLVHEMPPSAIPAAYPIADPRRFPWWDFGSTLAEVGDLIDDDARRGLDDVLQGHAGWRDLVGADAVVCHGDVHPGNVLMGADGPVLLDWDLLCWAHPAWDHSMLAGYARRWGGPPAAYAGFVDGYGTSFEGTALLDAVRDLRDVAATLMRVRAGRTDPEARAEADRRLEAYRGAPEPPVWRLQ